MKKIALFAVWMAALSIFVYKIAYAECPMSGSAEKAQCTTSSSCPADPSSSMKHCHKGTPKYNFVPGNKKSV